MRLIKINIEKKYQYQSTLSYVYYTVNMYFQARSVLIKKILLIYEMRARFLINTGMVVSKFLHGKCWSTSILIQKLKSSQQMSVGGHLTLPL